MKNSLNTSLLILISKMMFKRRSIMYIELMSNVARMMLQSNATDDEILKKTQITEQQLQDIKDVVAREHKTNIDKEICK